MDVNGSDLVTQIVFDDTKTDVDEMKSALDQSGYSVTGVTYQHINLTPQEAKEMIDTHPDLMIIDVREDSEFCGSYGHIPGSVNYPWTSGVLRERYHELPKDKDILVVCRSGNRSDLAADFLDSQGFTSVYDVGGMMDWEWETLTCSDEPPVLSLEGGTDGTVSLTWTQYTGAYFETYTLLRNTDPDAEYPDGYFRDENDPMATSYNDEEPPAGTSYYRVCVIKTQGDPLCSENVRAYIETSGDEMWHSADYNPRDYRIGLSELLRVIQFYNNKGYRCASETEDGYDVLIAGRKSDRDSETCTPHSSDYAPQDWRISLSELLRMIQLYNARGYQAESGTEDGFAPINQR